MEYQRLESIGSFGFLVFLIGGIPQFVAIGYGLNEWFDMDFFVSLFIGLFTTYIPFIGAIIGYFMGLIILEWNVYVLTFIFFVNILGALLSFKRTLTYISKI